MKRIIAIEKAAKIATLVNAGIEKIKKSKIKNLPLLAMLPLLKLQSDVQEGKELSLDSMVPHIFDILIFGSVANSNEEVNDIDMMIIDNGVMSNFLECDCAKEDWYKELSDNLEVLLGGWFDYEGKEINNLIATPVDLHVFPVQMFKDGKIRTDIQAKHKDPEFLKNCFDHMLRYDKSQHAFVSTDIAYFEKRYGACLDDLKKA